MVKDRATGNLNVLVSQKYTHHYGEGLVFIKRIPVNVREIVNPENHLPLGLRRCIVLAFIMFLSGGLRIQIPKA